MSLFCPVETLQNSKELAEMVDLYQKVKPKTVLEIGSLYGGTLYHWMDKADWLVKIVSIDLEVRNKEMWFSWLKDGQSLVAFQGNSSNPEMVESVLKTFPDGVDWLFIDGGHAYHEARDDYFNYFPLVRPGGYCLFHDIIGELGVVALWKEIKAAGVNVTEISHEPPYLGIGIIQKA